MKHYYVLAEYCTSDFYAGWWLYVRDHNDGRPNRDSCGGDFWGWLRDNGPHTRQAEVRELCVSMGYDPPACERYSQALAEWFAKTFPAGLRVTIGANGEYLNPRRVARLPKQKRRDPHDCRSGAIRTIAELKERRKS